MGTGSEVTCGIDAHERLLADGIRNRVVSLPCWELSDAQSAEHRESVLPAAVPARIDVEQASTSGWERRTGSTGRIIGMRSFGPSAPPNQLLTKFGCTPDAVVAAAMELV